MTQIQYVSNTLKRGNSITPIDALKECGCFRLAAIIFELRKKGYNILTKLVKSNHGHYASYSLAQED